MGRDKTGGLYGNARGLRHRQPHRDALRFKHSVQTAVTTANDRNRFGQCILQVSQRSDPDRSSVRQRMEQLAAAKTAAAARGQQNSNDFHERALKGAEPEYWGQGYSEQVQFCASLLRASGGFAEKYFRIPTRMA